MGVTQSIENETCVEPSSPPNIEQQLDNAAQSNAITGPMFGMVFKIDWNKSETKSTIRHKVPSSYLCFGEYHKKRNLEHEDGYTCMHITNVIKIAALLNRSANKCLDVFTEQSLKGSIVHAKRQVADLESLWEDYTEGEITSINYTQHYLKHCVPLPKDATVRERKFHAATACPIGCSYTRVHAIDVRDDTAIGEALDKKEYPLENDILLNAGVVLVDSKNNESFQSYALSLIKFFTHQPLNDSQKNNAIEILSAVLKEHTPEDFQGWRTRRGASTLKRLTKLFLDPQDFNQVFNETIFQVMKAEGRITLVDVVSVSVDYYTLIRMLSTNSPTHANRRCVEENVQSAIVYAGMAHTKNIVLVLHNLAYGLSAFSRVMQNIQNVEKDFMRTDELGRVTLLGSYTVLPTLSTICAECQGFDNVLSLISHFLDFSSGTTKCSTTITDLIKLRTSSLC